MLPDPNTSRDASRNVDAADARSRKPKKKRKPHRSRTARITIAFFQFSILLYTGLIVGLLLMETRLVYPGAFFEDRVVSQIASQVEIETVEYPSSEQLTLRGRLIERPQATNFLLFFHGNGTKAAWLDNWLWELSEYFDATVMIAEYRGFADDVTPTEKGVIEDCFAARDYFCNRYSITPPEIILYGRSLGGGCAVAVASQGGAKALVLDRTFDRLVSVAAEKYPVMPIRWLMRNRFDSMAKLTAYDGPLVMLHGTADQIVPIHHARNLFDSANCSPKHWIAVSGKGHNDAFPQQALSEAAAKVQDFTTPL